MSNVHEFTIIADDSNPNLRSTQPKHNFGDGLQVCYKDQNNQHDF